MEFPVGSVLVCRTLPDIKAGVFRAKRVAAATIRLRGFQCQEESRGARGSSPFFRLRGFG